MSSYSANDGKVIVKRLDAPVPKTCAHRISQLLLGFGPHFERFFGDDYKVHMASTGGLTLFTAEDVCTSEVVSHAGMIFNPLNPRVGALFNVFTTPAYRRRGLSSKLVQLVLKSFDAIGGSVCILGTGSPHAARTYQKEGFRHLAGGLECSGGGAQGYNPDDMGEWILVRLSNTEGAIDEHFNALDYYSQSNNVDDFEVQDLHRRHFPELVLLFNAVQANATDDGPAKVRVVIEPGAGPSSHGWLCFALTMASWQRSDWFACVLSLTRGE
eukprot:m.264300 g.264300  ORF g.264300 m.264300 type:complete len:270 (-) comp19715_c1_seq16:5994-6803(-)